MYIPFLPRTALTSFFRLSLYMAVTGGNDWSMYFDTASGLSGSGWQSEVLSGMAV